MTDTDGLLFAGVLDGVGGARALDWPAISSWKPDDGVLWVHLDRTRDQAVSWIREESGIDPAVAETLLAHSGNRPRVQRIGDALLVILRGINRNPGEQPDDLVAMHIWVEPRRVVSLRRRRLLAGQEIREQLESTNGPRTPGEFLVEMAERLVYPMGQMVEELEDEVDDLQSRVLDAESAELRILLRTVRRSAISLRRYLAPQRDAMSRLHHEQVRWLTDTDRSYLRELADRTMRFVEDLDEVRERAAVAQDELNSRIADQMNRTMYVLTVVAALFLPPSLLTGLFGINVGGMPWVDSPWGFSTLALSLPLIGWLEFVFLRRLRVI